MLEDTPNGQENNGSESAPAEAPAKKAAARKTAAKKAPAKKTVAKKTTGRAGATTKATAPTEAPETPEAAAPATDATATDAAAAAPVKKTTTRTSTTRKTTARKAPAAKAAKAAEPTEPTADTPADEAAEAGAALPLFQAPEPAAAAPAKKAAAKKSTAKKSTAKKSTAKKSSAKKSSAQKSSAQESAATQAAPARTEAEAGQDDEPVASSAADPGTEASPDATPAPAEDGSEREAAAEGQSGEESGDDSGEGGSSSGRRRRRRGGRRRRKSGGGGDDAQGGEQQDASDDTATGQADDAPEDAEGSDGDGDQQGEGGSSSSRRRRRRRRAGEDSGQAEDDPRNTVTRVRQGRTGEDQIQSVTGSTRLEAKKQRRREGREAGRRRAPIVSEAEFLARRESVDRVMAIRQRDDLTQIAVLEDKVLVEHYVARESQTSLIGNVYLGRVQNVLPSMEAAFIDIGKGRNAVLYAGEVNWSSLGHQEGQPRKIESVLSSGQTVLVQVTKDPVGHKGARLTSQISLAGRFLVYVPDGTNSGISRKLPDTERNRLKALLKEIVPDGAGVIVRTAAEGASEEELTRDVERLKARWDDIEKGAKKGSGGAQLLYGEPDLMLKVVRDLFTEDFSRLVVQGDDAWDTVHDYVTHVAPDLAGRLEQHPSENDGTASDLFAAWRIDEQIHKGLDRKVWLPSGGSLIIDRTEAMTVVDVNTGKFTGSGGNLEETVTKNNLEAAEEMVRQLRLRDIGGIIVVDFIDMVLESNRDLVLRRLVECLGRDRTKHQVAEVTSLGLVQMTRKRIGTGLLEAFSETCEHCQGRGLLVSDVPVEPKREQEPKRSRRSRGGKGRGDQQDDNGQGGQDSRQDDRPDKSPSPKDVAAMARPHADPEEKQPAPELPTGQSTGQASEKPEPVDVPDDVPVEKGTPEKPVVQKRSRKSVVVKAEKPAEPEPDQEKPAEKPAEEPAAPEQAQAKPAEPGPTPEEPAEAEAVAPEPPAAPKVVTRTRRRSASRPAGPPAGAASEPTPEPGSEAESETRAGTGVVGLPPADGAVEPGTADTEAGTRPTVEHVPVKKRGSARKR